MRLSKGTRVKLNENWGKFWSNAEYPVGTKGTVTGPDEFPLVFWVKLDSKRKELLFHETFLTRINKHAHTTNDRKRKRTRSH
jgi:hypothetical protein